MTNHCAKHKDVSWDFRKSDTKEFTHCFHSYPAMMIPQVVRRLLARYGKRNGWLLDPYCGTGTSLVEASMFGMNAVGCDINPLVRLIASAKTCIAPTRLLDQQLNDLKDKIEKGLCSTGTDNAPYPDILNMDYWFSEDVASHLAALRKYILSVEMESVRNFLLVAFSETVRECSYTRNGEFKLVRVPVQKLETHNPDVIAIFIGKLARNRKGLETYRQQRKDVKVSVTGVNTAREETPYAPRAFDLVITSPPYGDSPTTVAYGQFSRLSAEWIGLPGARTVDRTSMGGSRRQVDLPISPVSSAIEKINSVDSKRSLQVIAFYADLMASIETVSSILSKESTVCYVVGNRRVRGVTLPTDEFVVDSFEQQGFSHVETIVRNIPNKRMPMSNSPTNVAGKTDTTMREECIVICQRGS